MVVHIILALEKLRQEDNGFIASRITLRPFLKTKQKQKLLWWRTSLTPGWRSESEEDAGV